MLGSLQAFQGPQGLQQLQQLAMLQQAGGNQMNPQAQFLFQNQVSRVIYSLCFMYKFTSGKVQKLFPVKGFSTRIPSVRSDT